ncbi:hypothetical protein Tco_0167548 [Tanacetum coccineum]
MADGARSSRVTVPLPEDPYEAIRQAYLDGMDTESEPFEDPIDIETPELPLTIAPPISLSESTPPILVPILRRTARMAVRVPHAMSSGLSASMAEVAAMSESAFRKRFQTSCESSPSVSPPDFFLDRCSNYRRSVIEGDGGSNTEDEDPAAEDEGLTARVEGPGIDYESYGLDSESHGMDDDSRGLDDEWSYAPLGLGYEALMHRELALEADDVYSTFEVGHGSGSVPEFERPERVSASRQPTLTTWTDPEDGIVYINVPTYPPPAPPVQTPPSPEWTSGSLPISPTPFNVPSPISSPIDTLICTFSSMESLVGMSDGVGCLEVQLGRHHAPSVMCRESMRGNRGFAVTACVAKKRLISEWDIQAAGSDTRPPMLDRTDYESWSQRIRLYCRGKENGLQILQSIDQAHLSLEPKGGPRNYPEGGVLLGQERPHKAIWDNAKMLLAQVPNSQKKDRESQLYDGVSGSRCFPVVKLNKGLKETNHEQLYAYLKQHEKHVAQDRLIIERITLLRNDQLGICTNNQLRASSKTRNQATIQDGRVVVQNVQGRQNQNQRPKVHRILNISRTSWAYCKPTENGAVLEWKGITLLDGEHGNTFDADVDNQPRQDFRSE